MRIKALILTLSLLLLPVAATAKKPIKFPSQIKQEQEQKRKQQQEQKRKQQQSGKGKNNGGKNNNGGGKNSGGGKNNGGKNNNTGTSGAQKAKLTYNSSTDELCYGNHRYKMVWVAGGSFMMGADDSEAYNDEKPVHRESVSGFYMGQTEVPQWLWKAVMGSNPSYWKGDNLPVENVSWDDCQAFLRKLNSITGKRFRLPTEPEWEYAARGGNQSRGYKYSGGNSIGSVAWYDGNSGNRTHEVATKVGNELDLCDMSGNVWEWTSDYWCNDYNSPRNSSSFVYRGGSWGRTARCCRVSCRDCYGSTDRFNNLGFRLAL